jgi:hypothetical protein
MRIHDSPPESQSKAGSGIDSVFVWAIVGPVVFVCLCAAAIFGDIVPIRSSLVALAVIGAGAATVIEVAALSTVVVRLIRYRAIRTLPYLALVLFSVCCLSVWIAICWKVLRSDL